MLSLTAENVEKVLRECLYEEGETVDGWPMTELVAGTGVLLKCGFHKDRLEAHRADIEAMLDELPEQFKEGWSFLCMCNDKHGMQWGEHRNMDQLVCLGTAIGRLKLLAPRETWAMLPGGMPYYQLVPSEQQNHDAPAAVS